MLRVKLPRGRALACRAPDAPLRMRHSAPEPLPPVNSQRGRWKHNRSLPLLHFQALI